MIARVDLSPEDISRYWDDLFDKWEPLDPAPEFILTATQPAPEAILTATQDGLIESLDPEKIL